MALAELSRPAAAAAQDGQKQVLVLYSTRRDAQIVVVGERELPRILGQGLAEGLDYYSETIDQGRFPDSLYQEALRDFLRVKYRGRRFDAVIAMSDLAVEFVGRSRSELFPDTPVVFFSGSADTQHLANSTGVVAPLHFAGTLALAAKLQPDIQQVFVICGADSDQSYETLAREQFRPFEPGLTFTYLTGLPTQDLEARLATLPDHSIVYYLVVNRDGAGNSFHPLAYLDRLATVANAPVYSWVDSAMDHGIVGGHLKNLEAETAAVAELTLRVLRGEKADSIPSQAPDLGVNQVDWRQMRRWGIPEARVPADTRIMFRELTTWDRYRVYIIGALAVLLAQAVLIAGLLVQRSRRRDAEAQVRGNQAELRANVERIRDLGARLLNAQDSERSRIARELHDDISQQMALLAIDLELLGGAVRGETAGLAQEALSRAQNVARSVHDLSHRLHPARLRLIGLVAALSGLQRELSNSGVAIRFTHEDVPTDLPTELTVSIFRVVQEALQNALKYSGAHHISVHLSGRPDSLVLAVVDDGVGFDVQTAWGKGLGLISMRERLEGIGGTLNLRSTPGAGVRLDVSVPLASGSGSVAV